MGVWDTVGQVVGSGLKNNPTAELGAWVGANAISALSNANPSLGGKVSNVVNNVGNWLGNPTHDYGATQQGEEAGGRYIATTQGQGAADKMAASKGDIAGSKPGDYNVPTRTEQQIVQSTSGGIDRNSAASIKAALPGYAGWSDAAIIADYAATGGAGKGGSSGGGNPSGNQKTVTKNGQNLTVEDRGDNNNNAVDDRGKTYYDASLPSLDDQANWIFQDLDKQVEGYDSFRETMKTGLDTSASEQKQLAAESQQSNLADLAKNATNEQNQSASTLRDLTQNANDLLARLVQMYGGGSAAEAALTGMGRTINQQRGNVLTNRDAALREIDNKRTQVDTVYNSQLEKIKNWADGKLNDINLQIKQWTNDIAQAKASVRAQLSASAVNSARNYLTTLALNQQNYQNQLDYWKQSRQAELQDYATKLQLTAQYSPQQYSWNLNPVNTSSNGTGVNTWLGNNGNSNGNNGQNANDQTANIAQSDLMAKIKTNPLDSNLYDYSTNKG